MNAATVINLGYAVIFAVAGLVLFRLCRTPRRPSARARVAAALRSVDPPTSPGPDSEWVYDGPDSLQLLEDADRHLDQCAAADARLSGAFAPGAPIPDLTTHPDTDAGWARLRQALREHREEDQA